MSRTQDFERYKRFKEGEEDIKDNPRPWHPLTSKKWIKNFKKNRQSHLSRSLFKYPCSC